MTFIISLGAEIIHPKLFIYHLSDHKAVIIHLAGCVSFYGAKIIHPMHQLTNHSYHEASIIYLVSVGPRSSTPPLHWLIIHNTRPRSSTLCQQCLHDNGDEIIYPMYVVTLISRLWGWHSPSLSLINFIRPQGRDHPPCWLCISVYGAEIICSMHPMTNHSMPHLYLLLFISCLGAGTIHPYISFIISLKLQGHGHPPCGCVSQDYLPQASAD